jgi:hypothetical protein
MYMEGLVTGENSYWRTSDAARVEQLESVLYRSGIDLLGEL